MIIFFAYFYTAIIFNPADVADNMRKYGGFVPGIRPGKKTAEYIDRTLSRLTLVGALYLSFIVILPTYLVQFFMLPFFFGGTGLLIVGRRGPWILCSRLNRTSLCVIMRASSRKGVSRDVDNSLSA
jgi:preprotein translocase subunit SecY